MIVNDIKKMSQMSQTAVPVRKKTHDNMKKTESFTVLCESVYLGEKVALQLLHL